jgi:acyl dehydratase
MHEPVAWSVVARNLPEHAGNTIHTDRGARAAGYPAALIAGVTTYAYLTPPCVDAWGLDWLERGGGEVRFRAPVFDGDRVDCVPTTTAAGATLAAICTSRSPEPRAIFEAVRVAGEPPRPRDGRELPVKRIVLAGQFGWDYGARAGDEIDVYGREGIVHPAVWPALANRVYSTELVRGPWIHTRSLIRHHALGPAGATVDVFATVVEEFERNGRRAMCDVRIELDGRVLVTIEHEAIVELADRGDR